MNLVDELHRITAALERAGIRYAVCGGIASIRLDRLRALWKPLTQDEARALTEDAAGLTQRESFEGAVARRLDELRALSEMTMALRPASDQEPEPAR